MATISKNFQANAGAVENKFNVTLPARLTLSERYNLFIEELKFSHFGLMVMALLIGTCVGSISAMFVFYNNGPMWAFAIGMFAAVANLVTCISQMPTKWMVNIFFISLIINISLLILFPII